MNCDFYQDDNGEIWLFYAEDILYRPQMKSEFEIAEENQIKLKQLEQINQKRTKMKLEVDAKRAINRKKQNGTPCK